MARVRRPHDWLRQAELDLAAARDLSATAHYEWACFLCQQAAEKGVKALHESQGIEAWGHAIVGLLAGVEEVPDEVLDAGRVLDRHYIPTRYPNTHPAGAPGDMYTARDAEQALGDAETVLDHVQRRIP